MSTFVFVPGAWHWAGCFLKVGNRLAEQGHRILAVDLATHGFDATPVGAVADMEHYTDPVRTAVEGCPEPVVLVGHSMGGATLTYLGERMPERIRKLVYLTAFMTPNGRSANDYVTSQAYQGDPMARELFELVSFVESGVKLDLSDAERARAAFYGECSDHDLAIALKNVIPITPLAPFVWPCDATEARFGRLERVYIECLRDKTVPLAQQRRMQQDVPGAVVASLDTDHSPFLSRSEELAGLLTKYAA